MKPAIEKEAFSLNEFCTRHGVSRHFAYDEIGAGRLQTYMIKNKRMVSRQAADAWQAVIEKRPAPIKARPLSLRSA